MTLVHISSSTLNYFKNYQLQFLWFLHFWRDYVVSLFVWPWSAMHETKTLKRFLKEQSTCWQHSESKHVKVLHLEEKGAALCAYVYRLSASSVNMLRLSVTTNMFLIQSFFPLRKCELQFSVALFLFSALWIHLQLETVIWLNMTQQIWWLNVRTTIGKVWWSEIKTFNVYAVVATKLTLSQWKQKYNQMGIYIHI